MRKIPINKATPENRSDWWPESDRQLCRLADLPEDAARGFTLQGGRPDDKLELIVWRSANNPDAPNLRGFVNKCPHLGLPLETFPDRFLTADATALICSAHGAQFDFDGACFSGPCKGQAMTAINLAVETCDGEAVIVMKNG